MKNDSTADKNDVTPQNSGLSPENYAVAVALAEAGDFIIKLSKGDLDIALPGRENALAGPLKQLHSKISTLKWGMDQLADGRMVNKLSCSGELFASFNALVDIVAALSSSSQSETIPEWSESGNSWRHHQILMALNSLRVMVFDVREDGTIIYANRLAKQYIGELNSVNQSLSSGKRPALIAHMADFPANDVKFPSTAEVHDRDENAWYKVTSDLAVFIDGSHGYRHVVDDISEWKNRESLLRHTASTDSLTKACNRKAGIQALENTISPAGVGFIHCAAFIDVDNLKIINDDYGHTEGDWALKTFAETFLTCVRDDDIVSRYGGDEFLIVFNRCDKESAEKAVCRMYEKVDEINVSKEKPFLLSFSHGLVEIKPGGVEDVTEIIHRMDTLMYENKRLRKYALKEREAYMECRGYHHIGLWVSDTERSLKFYRDVLGGKIKHSFTLAGLDKLIYLVDIGGAVVEIIQRGNGEEEQNARWAHIALEVSDTNAAYSLAMSGGAISHSEPEDIMLKDKLARIAFVKGPDGEMIEFFEEK